MDNTYKYSEGSCNIGKINNSVYIYKFTYIYMLKLLEKRS